MDKSLEALIDDMKAAAEKATKGPWVAFTDTASKTFSVHTPDDNRCENIIKWTGFDGQKNAKNNAEFIASVNPENVMVLIAALEAAVVTLEYKGYTWHGGQQWKPPLGPKPDFDLLSIKQARIDELESELEQAQQREQEWKAICESAAIDLDEWTELDKKSGDLICKLADAFIKQGERIAELESLCVKLPALARIHSNWAGEYMLKSDVIEAIRAAGGTVGGE